LTKSIDNHSFCFNLLFYINITDQTILPLQFKKENVWWTLRYHDTMKENREGKNVWGILNISMLG